MITLYKVDARTNKRAWIRLGSEVEKIKKQLGMNTTNLPLNIECFMDDKDVSASINRGQFEEICADLIDRVEPPLQQAIAESGTILEIIVGSYFTGSAGSYTPFDITVRKNLLNFTNASLVVHV